MLKISTPKEKEPPPPINSVVKASNRSTIIFVSQSGKKLILMATTKLNHVSQFLPKKDSHFPILLKHPHQSRQPNSFLDIQINTTILVIMAFTKKLTTIPTRESPTILI